MSQLTHGTVLEFSVFWHCPKTGTRGDLLYWPCWMYAINYFLVIPVRAYIVRTYRQLNTPWMWHWCVQYRCTSIAVRMYATCTSMRTGLRTDKQILTEAGEPAYRPAYEHSSAIYKLYERP